MPRTFYLFAEVVTEAEVAGDTVTVVTTTTTAEVGVGATTTVPGAEVAIVTTTATTTTAAKVRQHPRLLKRLNQQLSELF